MIFTWDDTKDEINYETHGIHLISARIASAQERRIYNGQSNDEIKPWGPAY